MKKSGISLKLMAILLFAELGCLAAAIGGLWLTRGEMLRDRQEQLRGIIAAAHSVTDYFHRQETAGQLSGEEAQRLALGALRDLRYGENGYLVIYSTDGTLLAHGVRPEREGSEPYRDERGVVFDRQKLIDAARQGGGFQTYSFPRPGEWRPVEKLAYAQLYGPWNWVLTSGLYLDDLSTAFQRHCLLYLAFLLPLTVLLTAQVTLLSRGITQPLRRLSQAMRERLSPNRDQPRRPVDWRSDDELGDLVSSYNQLLAQQSLSERKLLEIQASLEDKVAERTQQLDAARKQAERASRAKTDFLASVSHEIRTPMNAIVGLSHLLSRTRLDDHQRDYLSKIGSSAKSLQGLLNDILDFSHIETRNLTLDIVPFRLDDLLRTLSDLMALGAGAKGVELLFDIDPKAPQTLRGDPLRIHQILANLTSNALKFTEKGAITISCQTVQDSSKTATLRFAVSDSGVGLSAEDQHKLFAPFGQGEPLPSSAGGGTGLGLAICKHLVTLMGGKMGVESRLGRGSTFWFTLRLEKDRETESATPIPGFFADLRVLVADDNLLVRHALSAMVRGLGCHVVTVANSQAVLDQLTAAGTQPFDLVILDWMMPEIDGVETVRRIRGLGLAETPHLVMVSGYGRDELLSQVLSLGIDGILCKPVNRAQLRETLERCFRLSGALPAEQPAYAFPSTTRVLLVEDNEINRMVAEEILSGAGLSVTSVGNGRDALEAVLRQTFDVVLMDLQMPVMDGYEATRAIRGTTNFALLPIIALTANATELDRQRALDAGVNDYITKPFDPDLLLRRLHRWISRPGAEITQPPVP